MAGEIAGAKFSLCFCVMNNKTRMHNMHKGAGSGITAADKCRGSM